MLADFVEDISWQSYLDSSLVSIEKKGDAVSRFDKKWLCSQF